jgi:hypothetical protein
MSYYNKASKSESIPKVLFKLGANHVARGLNETNVYDISNMVSELAISNGKKSLHIYAIGITGKKSLGNPFSPVPMVSFDNIASFPEEIQMAIKDQNKKYFILDLTELRTNSRAYSKELQKLMFAYDVMILVKDAQPLNSF